MEALAWAWLHPEELNKGAGKTTFSSGGTWDLYNSVQNLPIYKSINLPAAHSRRIFAIMSHARMLSERVSLSPFFFFSCGVDFWMQKCVSYSSYRNNSFIIVKCFALFVTSESSVGQPCIDGPFIPLLYISWRNKQKKNPRQLQKQLQS